MSNRGKHTGPGLQAASKALRTAALTRLAGVLRVQPTIRDESESASVMLLTRQEWSVKVTCYGTGEFFRLDARPLSEGTAAMVLGVLAGEGWQS